VRLLLDTHAAIWAVDSPKLLASHIKDLMIDPGNEVYVSAASIWEIAIKSGLRKRGALPFSSAEAMYKFREAGFRWLDITPEHTAAVEDLPLLHADPFDRLLIAQAVYEPMRLISHDDRITAYSDLVITW
jgi:PIN domain nuclease of toxin-antitoxin system